MTAAERAAHIRRVAELQRIREEEEQLRHAEAAQQAQRLWDGAAPAREDHPYLQKKGIHPHGLRVDDENRLIVPVTIDGVLTSTQSIDGTGAKLFFLGGAVKGGSYTIGDLTEATTVLICEGFATGASLHEAIGYPTVCAFSANFMTLVAQGLRQRFQTAMILVCGDNDIHNDGKPNAGLDAATAAASAINGVLVMPELDGQKCDWNDVHIQRGLNAVRLAITAPS